MFKHVLAVCLVLAFAFAGSAQVAPATIDDAPSAAPQDPRPASDQPPVFGRREVAPDAPITGATGKIDLDGTAGTWPFTVAGVAMLSTNQGYPDIVARLGGANGNYRFLNHANTPLLNITNGGFVGVGTSDPRTYLDVGGWAGLQSIPTEQRPSGVIASFAGDAFFGNTDATPIGRMRVASNVAQGFFQWNVHYDGSKLRLTDTSKPGYDVDLNSGIDGIEFRRYEVGANDTLNVTSLLKMVRDKVSGAHQVTVTGKLSATGGIAATYQDIAEWVPATTDMAPGTVVVLNPEAINEVMPSGRAYDTAVAGVVSAQPGLVLGEGSDTKEQIATYGRVKVRVDATRGPIKVGDLLVTSDKPGTAMKSQPVDVAGVAMHRPGTLIGKALEPLEGGVGEILVLLSLQ